MVRSVQIFSAALIAVAIAAPAAHAETTQTPTRQITVHKATPSWLTLGTAASVGAGNNYVTETFDQPSPVEGTFSGYRGRERLDANRFNGPGVPLFRF